mmetsp:Transcript_29668/g.81552  ORF Transcript_29668/g.81552 Transcript_29668/m.81552 type:complete len:390 (-) Transcript_29668:210-1379(-)|eukprot:CAMPEP_0168726038 /NCGR_PEP_ID=MMETSP0724-20121128/4464_1 /TAXON_ID=265536 /ORGANISM="Amphiprora sp., Strain CCMP467" /LENGTH=389 /DNA_ID=CAMNT_0008772843 /DNA_START=80 /DNA_END=1249 /DNA_ORIENTATION=+
MVVVMLTTLFVCIFLLLLALLTFLLGLYDRPQIRKGPLLPGIAAAAAASSDKDNPATTTSTSSPPCVVFALVVTTHRAASLALERKFARAARQVLDDDERFVENGKEILRRGARAYLDPSHERTTLPDALSVGFFYTRTTATNGTTAATTKKDEANKTTIRENKGATNQQSEGDESLPPKWAIGWLCRQDDIDWDALQSLIQEEKTLQSVGLRLTPEQVEAQQKPSLKKLIQRAKGALWNNVVCCWKKNKTPKHALPPEELRLIRLPPDMPVLRGSFPWRTFLTPAIAAQLHWGRALKEWVQQGESANKDHNDNDVNNNNTPIAMEVYVRNWRWGSSRVDYNLVLGDNEGVWEDAHPGFSTSLQQSRAATSTFRKEARNDEEDDIVIDA